MKAVGIIPARFASSRFPGKPLVDIAGKTMIRRVCEQASLARGLSEVVVATDDERIFNHVQSFGGNVIMTKDTHQSGTDRCAEVLQCIDADVVVNIQGDEPFVNPLQIELLLSCFDSPDVQIATLVKKIEHHEELLNTNTPKVVLGTSQDALYFSRQTIPFFRGQELSEWLKQHTYYKHIGIYAYRSEVLTQITQLAVSTLERVEALEQLRWLENGYKIRAAITEYETVAVDVPEDLDRLKPFLNP